MDLNAENVTRAREGAKALIEALDRSDQEGATESLSELAAMKDETLFNELGHLVREFHESLNEYERESYTQSLAEEHLPDAGDRLYHVLNLTQNAAHRTLTAVEKGNAKLDEIAASWISVAGILHQLLEKELDLEQRRRLQAVLAQRKEGMDGQINDMKTHMTEVIMAQEFQDLAGQVIKKVATLVSGVHLSLVSMLGEASGATAGSEETGDKDDSTARITSQEDVDDLLASLGF